MVSTGKVISVSSAGMPFSHLISLLVSFSMQTSANVLKPQQVATRGV